MGPATKRTIAPWGFRRFGRRVDPIPNRPVQEYPLPVRARVLALAFLLVFASIAGAVPGARPTSVAAAGPKVVVIVGPVGTLTSNYRSRGNATAVAAEAAGATVVKVYSPNATWANVRSAVNGANVIVYFGHGNGYPNPYTSGTEYTDRVNGWGLNRTTTNGDSDNWSTTMVYCGEKALLGTLTASDGAAQRQYCSGGPITPAAGFTMVYGQAHYAPGFGERYDESDPITTLTQARQRVTNYSTPVLRLGAGGYFATAYGDADEIVSRVLTQPNSTYAQVFRAGTGYSADDLSTMNHPDVAGAQVWVQRTVIDGFHFGDPDYWYAFAGDPNRVIGGSFCEAAFSDICGNTFEEHITWAVEQGITTGCGGTRFCPDAPVTRNQMASFIARALDLPPATHDYFSDDNGQTHEADINKVAEAGITGGCADGLYCPTDPVYREQMASFLARALAYADTDTDYFSDDATSSHEPDINRFAEAGVTTGCAPGLYCPNGTVTRAQMTAFLHRALV
jgi:hypothetical protein